MASGLALPSGLGLHVITAGRHDDDSPRDGEADADPRIAEVTAAIVEALPAPTSASALAQQPGELFADVATASAAARRCRCQRAGRRRALAAGLHRHCLGRSPHPGGRLPLRLPPEAPSRAWLKLEEGLAFSGLGLRPGQVGRRDRRGSRWASWALLQRGLTVVGR